MGETCFLLEGGCRRADTDGDNFDMVTISVSLFGDVWEQALSKRCEHDILLYLCIFFSHDSGILGPTMLFC